MKAKNSSLAKARYWCKSFGNWWLVLTFYRCGINLYAGRRVL